MTAWRVTLRRVNWRMGRGRERDIEGKEKKKGGTRRK